MVLVEPLFIVTGSIQDQWLSFKSRWLSSSLTMVISRRTSMIRIHGSWRWKCLTLSHMNFLHCQYLAATTDHITVLSTAHTADISTCGRSGSLCAVWVCHWRDGYSYVFSTRISRKILPFYTERLYSCRSHYTHQYTALSGCFIPRPQCCSSAKIGASQYPSMVLNPCQWSAIAVSAPQSPLVHLNHYWHCSVWIGSSIFHSALHTAYSVQATPLGWALCNPLLNLNWKRL